MFTYSLELSDGSPAPDYLSIDSTSGVVTFNSETDQPVNSQDQIIIAISATDNVMPRVTAFRYPYVQRTEPIALGSFCGPESTVITSVKLD